MPLKIIRQDITKTECDAIVNPTNCALYPDGGTDAAIHRAAGDELYRYVTERIGSLSVAEAQPSPAFKLPSKYVIHTVGPRWIDGTKGELSLLKKTYHACLERALSLGCESIAFPLISSGEFGVPKGFALRLAIDEITSFLLRHEMTVVLTVFDAESYLLSRQLFLDVSAYIDETYVSEDLAETEHWLTTPPESRIARIKSIASYKRRRIPDEDAECFPLSDSLPSAASKLPDSASLEGMLKHLDDSFAVTLLKLIDQKGMNEIACYKRANVSKQTWYKILNEKDYRPSKSTVLSFAIALELSFNETQALLETVGYTLSKSNRFDVIISYFLLKERYDIFEIEETLLKFDQPTLASYH